MLFATCAVSATRCGQIAAMFDVTFCQKKTIKHERFSDLLYLLEKGAITQMRLLIARNQAKGMLGSIKFEMSAKVELTQEEAELVKKYKVEKEPLLKKEIKIPLTGRALVLNLTIGSLVNGQIFKCEDIGEILEYERNVKESCEAFKALIEVMKVFGGQEVVDY